MLKKSQSFHVSSNGNSKEMNSEEPEEPTIVQNPIFKPRAILIELLLSPEFELVNALGECVLVGEEGRTLAEALVDFFHAHNKLDKLMEWAISKEINSTNSTSTLFRGACEATKLMPVLYSRLGTDYIRQLVGPLVRDITSSSSSFEIDPNKAEKGVDVKDNLKKVLSITTEFLQNIYESLERCPNFLRYIFGYAKREVTKKFPQASSIIVGVFFFLRFMIPAIVTPTSYGLSLEPPSPEAQRGLILISKLLQNLSNGILFDDTQAFFYEMNAFIHEKMVELYAFFHSLAQSATTVESPLFVSGETEMLALTILSNAIKDHKERIFNLLVSLDTKRMFMQYSEGPIIIPPSDTGTPNYDTLRSRSLVLPLRKKDKKLEENLEEEIKHRKALERRVVKLEERVKCYKELLDASVATNAVYEERLVVLEEQFKLLLKSVGSKERSNSSEDKSLKRSTSKPKHV